MKTDIEYKDPIAESCRDMHEKRDLNAEGLAPGYDVYTPNAETVRICRENEKKKPVRIPDDSAAYFKKIMKIRD